MKRILTVFVLLSAICCLVSCPVEKVPTWLHGIWDAYDESYTTKRSDVYFEISDTTLLRKGDITTDYMQYVLKWMASVTESNSSKFIIAGNWEDNGSEKDHNYEFVKTSSNRVLFKNQIDVATHEVIYLQKRE